MARAAQQIVSLLHSEWESLDNQKAQTTQGLLHIWLIAAHADNCLVAHKIGTFYGHWLEKQETSTANKLESPPPPPNTAELRIRILRPAGGVKHSDSDLVETRMLSAKKALRWIEGSIPNNSRKF